MRNKRFLRVLAALAAVLIAVPLFSMTALAYTDEDAEIEAAIPEIMTPEELEPTSDPEPTPEPTPEPDPLPLTPDGNLTLVDDISGEQAADKQFITVVSKSGNYFYLVIDRAGDRENVYFLNLVDEADLLALMDGETQPAPVAQAAETPEPTVTEEPAPEPEESNMGGIVILLVLLAALGGGAFYYFKVLKPKRDATKGAVVTELDELEDYDFGGDDGETYGEAAEQDGEDYGGGDELDDSEEMPDFGFFPESEDRE